MKTTLDTDSLTYAIADAITYSGKGYVYISPYTGNAYDLHPATDAAFIINEGLCLLWSVEGAAFERTDDDADAREQAEQIIINGNLVNEAEALMEHSA